ncbi:HxlR family transcriptional regulator [Arthrobacter sp. SW1]|uniref:winged helix-turn-helix transcriptional regulator n=1 Tax=Arthrobacter sp. SW1 TaxID=1920889 RepID=UPI000877B9D4|nr:helix-turn-helix domain-containing protein [Arthrobacter sp. SW1]OFI38777.1 HxlR family transcriptional regulator [Arthrobacter sp. SW1]
MAKLDETLAAPATGCRISPAVDLLFSRWTTPILWTLNQSGPLRFVDLQQQLGSITAKVLTQRLRQFERDGLVERRSYGEVPPRVEYEITDLGRSLSPVFASLAYWTENHLPAVEEARASYTGPLPR